MTKEVKAATSNASNQTTEVVNQKEEKNMNGFNFSLGTESAVNEYDNVGAYQTVQEMMARNEQLSVRFYTGKDGIICAWIESSNVAGYKYQLNNKSYLGIMNYLTKGEVSDFDSNPRDVTNLGEEVDFELEVMKTAIKEGKRLQYVPLFRERPEYIKAFLPCFKGKIMFRIKRTDEVLDYLRENKQTI